MLKDICFAAIVGFGFAYACNSPLKTLILSAILAAIAYVLRFSLLNFGINNIAIATFIASFCIGCLGILLAKLSKTPAEIIAFPALIPMIPGIYAYKAILNFISFTRTENIELKNKFLTLFFDEFFTTIFVSISLARH